MPECRNMGGSKKFGGKMAGVCLVFLLALPVCGGERPIRRQVVPADTSFTIRSEYTRQVRNFPGIVPAVADTGGLVLLRDLVYARRGRRALHLDLFRAAGESGRRMPVVLLIHGGGWRSGDKTLEWPMAAALARQGMVTLCVEYRLSTEALYPAAAEDILSAIRWVLRHARTYGFDPNRIALYGTSSGGQLAALAGSVNGTKNLFRGPCDFRLRGRIRAVADVDGILAFVHPESGEGADKPGRPSAATSWLGAPAAAKPELWLEASPLTHVNARSAPVLFINSSLPRFHAGRDDTIRKLDSLRIYSEVHTLENTPHTFWLFHPWFDRVASVTADFFHKVMPEVR